MIESPKERPPKRMFEPVSSLITIATWIAAYLLASVVAERGGGALTEYPRRGPGVGSCIIMAIVLYYGLDKRLPVSATLAVLGIIFDIILIAQLLMLSQN